MFVSTLSLFECWTSITHERALVFLLLRFRRLTLFFLHFALIFDNCYNTSQFRSNWIQTGEDTMLTWLLRMSLLVKEGRKASCVELEMMCESAEPLVI